MLVVTEKSLLGGVRLEAVRQLVRLALFCAVLIAPLVLSLMH